MKKLIVLIIAFSAMIGFDVRNFINSNEISQDFTHTTEYKNTVNHFFEDDRVEIEQDLIEEDKAVIEHQLNDSTTEENTPTEEKPKPEIKPVQDEKPVQEEPQKEPVKQEPVKQETSVTPKPQTAPEQKPVVNNEPVETPKPEVPKPQQALILHGREYHFKQLELKTQVAQSYIDKNPNSLGLWKNVVYAGHRMDIYFGHDYGAGKIVYNAQVGDVITYQLADGSTKKYLVKAKTIASVNDYYTTNTPLWNAVGDDFDTMIKTCYKRDVTDLILALKTIE